MIAVKLSGERIQGFRDLLKGLMEKGVVEQVLVPFRIPTAESFAHLLTRDPEMISEASPIPPVITVQGARVVSKLTKRGPVEGVTAVVLRPCELRAMRELVKLNQVKPDGLLILSFDCPGAFPLQSYIQGDREKMDQHFIKGINGEDISGLRPVCQICHRFIGEAADIEIGFLGADPQTYYLIAHTPQGHEALEKLGYEGEESLEERGRVIKEKIEAREEERRNFFKDFGKQVAGVDGLLATIHNCMNCHNCMRVCPICFCRECFFDSDALKASPENYIMRARRKGGLRFLPDTLLFHLGRMNHMAISCVSCGACEDACPNSVPVSCLFAMVADRTQAIFGYISGSDLSESIPFIDYCEEELQEYEQPYTESLNHLPSPS